MMKNRAGLLALIVLAIASLLMVFFVLPRINQGSKPLGDAINAAGNAVQDAVKDGQPSGKPADFAKPTDPAKPTDQAKTNPPATPPAGAQSPSAASPSATGQAATAGSAKGNRPVDAARPTPSFDVLRVEPDGSTVIAGRAEPHATLEVTDGSSVVAKVNVGPSGDFAAVLDTPLPPGDHQLVLKATGKDGKSVLSEETATVSVPTDKNSGKLLAMVTTPGKASRLIATPGAPGAPAAPGAVAPTPAPQGQGEAQVAATAPQSPAASPASPSAGAASQAAQPPAALPETSLPALPEASGTLASNPPPAVTPGASAPATPAEAAAPNTAAELQITAVELEGNKIFIAGVAKAGSTVRGLADGKAIGQAQPGSDRHFVIEGTADLSVGDHTISVESLNGAGQALVRVEVPFNRPAGEQVAAVAAPATTSPMTPVDGGAFDKLRSDTVRAFNLLKNLYAGGKLPSMEQMTAARSGTSIALKTLSEYRLPAGAAASARMLAETTTKDASTAAMTLDKLPANVAAVGAALNDLGALVAKAVGPIMAQQIEGPDMADAAPQQPASSQDGPRTIQQAPLTQSQRASVIIRRGDTLWQISRRVYGQGVRYTTIYLANEDQINNPDIIQPGQIFGVPDEFRPDAEELHRQRMLHRKS